MIPEINSYKCTGCAECVKACPPRVIGIVRKKAAIIRDLCEECGECWAACPNNAMYLEMPFGSEGVSAVFADRLHSLITNMGF
jgi:heterodisulfide reductase subunit A-like polyferredoxin